jgi:LysM repeat protein
MKPSSAHPRGARTGARTATRFAVTALSASLTISVVAPATLQAAPAPSRRAAAEYVVKDGDYLAGIARKLGTTLPELLAANGLTVDSIVHPGDHLIVPAGATKPGATTPAAAAVTYTVKSGDSFFVIARKLGTPMADLLTANGLTVDSIVHPGAALVVPASATNPGAAAPVATPAAPAPSTYTVKSGDYLFGIARNYNIKLGTLLKLNNLTVDSPVHPGTQLLIPAGAVASSTAPVAKEGQVVSASSPAAVKIDAVVAFAKAQLGKPYRFNAAGPDAFDCSGLSAAAYAQIGLWLPHQSAMQSTRGVAVDWRTQDIQAGDLVFMFSKAHPTVISHLGIAINSWQWIHAPRSGDVVRIGPIPSDNVIQAVRRYVSD